MSKLNICMVVNNLNVGGLEKVVLSLLRHLDRSRFELFLICLQGEGKLFFEHGLPSSRCLVLDKNLQSILPGLKPDPTLVVSIRRFLSDNAIDIVHTHNLAPLLFAGIAARTTHPRPVVVYSEHNQVNRSKGWDRLKFRYYIRLADEIVAVSEDLRRILLDDIKVHAPLRVIHNGIDGARFSRDQADSARGRIRAELGIGEHETVFGTAVVLSEQKGIRYLLEAAPAVLQRAPSARFVVAGDGPLRQELVDRAAQAKLGDKVIFPGYRADVPELIASFDAYVLPSLWEGLPLALLEALALGKPIVATTVGGNPEIVEHGQNGFLVPPGDPRVLAEHLVRLIEDQALRARAREVNPAKFVREFSVDAMTRAHERLFDAIASRWRLGGRHAAGPHA